MMIYLAAILLLPASLQDERNEKGTPYFPYFSFHYRPDLDAFKEQWYSNALNRMGESSLYRTRAKLGLHTYRFLWLRSFHRPIAVRIEIKRDGTGALIGKALNGKGGYDPGHQLAKRDTNLDGASVGRLLRAVRTANFWKEPSQEQQPVTIRPDGGRTIIARGDGAQWVLEAVKEGKYHIVDRWGQQGRLGELGLLMLKFSRMTIEPIY